MKFIVPSAKKDLIQEQEIKNIEDTQNNLQKQIDDLKEDVEDLQKLCNRLIKGV